MKLSGPYRVAKDGNYARLKPLAGAIADALPDRTVWGSDWPHIPNGDMNTGQLLNLLAEWVPQSRARDRILSDNPGRLYAFDST
jgi:predicted TIM-barrel fold metal-dependent hydrolase